MSRPLQRQKGVSPRTSGAKRRPRSNPPNGARFETTVNLTPKAEAKRPTLHRYPTGPCLPGLG